MAASVATYGCGWVKQFTRRSVDWISHSFAKHAARQLRAFGLQHSPLSSDQSSRLLVIEAGGPEQRYWIDLWHYRELFAVLAWRDVAVRYKQTLIGIAWAIIRPLLTMVVFTVVFGKLAKLPSEGNAPYPILVFAGLLPWFLFSSILSEASNSLVSNSNLISKVYFPRIIVPVSASVVALVDFGANLLIFFGLVAWYEYAPSWHVALLPVFILFAVIASLGPALLITALNVKYRDVRYIIPFVIQFGLYVSPVGFSSDVVPDQLRVLYSLNPIVGVIDGFRWCLLGTAELDVWGLLASAGASLFLLWVGVRYFRRTERSFADII
ncbi:ABC transporter permease [Hyphomicrobium sp.]|uniref:ABC transporter permease n=1 Tax=Hyphomicrobium sp. TaxID=82 RepID=UPI0025C1D2E5|nr:ABC transporter permease [Hyphomicrobium sp.]